MNGKAKLLNWTKAIAAISLIAVSAEVTNAQEPTATPNTDTKSWKNPDFNTAVPDSKRNRLDRFKNKKGWQFTDEKELVPAVWRISSDAEGSYELESEGNYFIRLKYGYVTQYFFPQTQEKSVLKISFKARGTGSFTIWTCSYRNKTGPNPKGYDILKETRKYEEWVLTPEWKTYQFETKTAGVPTERVAVRFTVRPESDHLDLDDVYVTPFFTEKKD